MGKSFPTATLIIMALVLVETAAELTDGDGHPAPGAEKHEYLVDQLLSFGGMLGLSADARDAASFAAQLLYDLWKAREAAKAAHLDALTADDVTTPPPEVKNRLPGKLLDLVEEGGAEDGTAQLDDDIETADDIDTDTEEPAPRAPNGFSRA